MGATSELLGMNEERLHSDPLLDAVDMSDKREDLRFVWVRSERLFQKGRVGQHANSLGGGRGWSLETHSSDPRSDKAQRKFFAKEIPIKPERLTE